MFPLVSLSTEIWATIFCDWVHIRALAVLDSAMCSTVDRAEFLLQLRSSIYNHRDHMRRYNFEKGPHDKFLRWLLNRGLRFEHWVFAADYPPP